MKEMIKAALSKMLMLARMAIEGVFKWIKKVLRYARINDEKNNISLTNLAMMIVMYKMVVTNATSWQDLSALAIAILGYQIKRVIEGKKDQ